MRASRPTSPVYRPARRSAGLLRRALLLVVALLVAGAGRADAPRSVFVTVLPLAGFVERVGGERVAVEVMVRPGQDPHTYEPTPRQVGALGRAAAYFRIGMPFEEAWMRRIASTNPALVVVDLREGLPLRPMAAHAHDEHADGHEGERGHEHGGEQRHEHADGHDHDYDNDNERGHEDAHGAGDETDPHVWTSPVLARRIAATIRDRLTALDPAGAAVYAANQAALDADLAALDRELAAALAGLTQRSFLVYHPGWGYFADAYGLTQVPIERAGKEPGPRALKALIDQARASGARLVLVQPQFDQRAAATVAAAIGGRVATADDLAADYFGSLRALAALLVEADADAGPGAGSGSGSGADAGSDSGAGADPTTPATGPAAPR